MEYRVVRKFTDREDNNRKYVVGDKYQGKKSAKRISQLTNPEKNKYGEVYLEKEE